MQKFEVATNHPYDIIIDKNLIDNAGIYFKERIQSEKLFIITDSTVNSLYKDRLVSALSSFGYKLSEFVFPNGEESKNVKTYADILEALGSAGITRSDTIVALGGGVVGDISGFAAATYMRGIHYVQIPTTYLAAVDSSVGGKTAVNLKCGKNLAGAFWQPDLVLCDYSTFNTLPEEHMLEGMAEAIKYAVISEKSLIEHVKERDLEYVITHCLSIKKSIVETDEHDTGLRQLLNFGHTVGHGIEKAGCYSVSHGLAVAKGMVTEARAAYRTGLTETDISGELAGILLELGYDLSVNYSADELYAYAHSDKKISGGDITLVIPEALGKCILKKIPASELKSFISAGLE